MQMFLLVFLNPETLRLKMILKTAASFFYIILAKETGSDYYLGYIVWVDK